MKEISVQLLQSHRRRRIRTIVNKIFFWLFLIVVLFFTLFPFLWMVLAAFKTNSQITDPTQLFHFEPYFGNFHTVFERYDFIKPILNSFIVAVVSTALGLVLGLPAAYAIARSNRKRTESVILIVRFFPASPLCFLGILFSAVLVLLTHTLD